MRKYKLVQSPSGWPSGVPFRLHFPDGDFGIGEEFEAELSQEEEASNLAAGLIQIVPQRYRVAEGSVVHGHQPGEEFDASFTQFEEWHLLISGNLERVEEKPAPKSKPKAARAKE